MGKEINAILGAQTIFIWTYGHRVEFSHINPYRNLTNAPLNNKISLFFKRFLLLISFFNRSIDKIIQLQCFQCDAIETFQGLILGVSC